MNNDRSANTDSANDEDFARDEQPELVGKDVENAQYADLYAQINGLFDVKPKTVLGGVYREHPHRGFIAWLVIRWARDGGNQKLICKALTSEQWDEVNTAIVDYLDWMLGAHLSEDIRILSSDYARRFDMLAAVEIYGWQIDASTGQLDIPSPYDGPCPWTWHALRDYGVRRVIETAPLLGYQLNEIVVLLGQLDGYLMAATPTPEELANYYYYFWNIPGLTTEGASIPRINRIAVYLRNQALYIQQYGVVRNAKNHEISWGAFAFDPERKPLSTYTPFLLAASGTATRMEVTQAMGISKLVHGSTSGTIRALTSLILNTIQTIGETGDMEAQVKWQNMFHRWINMTTKLGCDLAEQDVPLSVPRGDGQAPGSASPEDRWQLPSSLSGGNAGQQVPAQDKN